MADPISGAAVGGFANVVGSKVIEAIVRGEDDHEEWLKQVVDVAAESEASGRYYGDSPWGSEVEALEETLHQQGKQAQKLAVIGERQNYDSEEVEAVRELAEVCGKIGKPHPNKDFDYNKLTNEELPRCVERIFQFTR